jgi:hypothetical protein
VQDPEIGGPGQGNNQKRHERQEQESYAAIDQRHPAYPPLALPELEDPLELLELEAPEPLLELAPLPEVSVLPEPAPLPELAPLPEVSVLPEPAPLPELAPLPEVSVLPEPAPLPDAAALLEEPPLPMVSLLAGDGSWATNWSGAGAWMLCNPRVTLGLPGTKLRVVGPGMTIPILAASRSMRV